MAARQGSQPTRTKKRSKPVRAKPKHAKKSAASQDYALGGELGSEIGGIFLVAGAALGFISLIQGPSGYVGGALANLMISAFGRGAYAVPALMALTGILMLWRRTGHVVFVRFVGLVIVCIAVVIGFELNDFGETALRLPFSQYVADSRSDVGGGLVGAAGAWVFLRLFGFVGSVIISIALGIAGLSIASDVPVATAVTFGAKSIWTGLSFLISMIRESYDAIVLQLFEVAPPYPEDESAVDRADLAVQFREGDCLEADRRAKTAPEPEIGAHSQERGLDRLKEFFQASQPDAGIVERMEPQEDLPEPSRGESSVGANEVGVAPSKTRPRQSAQGTKSQSIGSLHDEMEQLELINYGLASDLPPTSILKALPKRRARKEVEDPHAMAELLESTLASFGVEASVVGISAGPVVTRFEVQPGPGVKVSKIVNLADDLSLAFASAGVRIEAPIPGKAAVGIEVPSKNRSVIYLREVIESDEFQKAESRLTFAVGKDIAGKPIVADMADLLHLLVAGATGSGKSVCLNSIICSLLFKATPDEVRFLLIDPKRVELSMYDGIPHLLAPVVTDAKKASGYLRWVVEEMENRYRLFQIAGARNIGQYNEMVRLGIADEYIDADANIAGSDVGTDRNIEGSEADAQGGSDVSTEANKGKAAGPRLKPLSYIVVIIDELADLMLVAQREVEDAIARLAFMARAAGIHLIIATQRPSVDIVTGIIKSNIPSRIAFAVSSQVDSRIILDSSGAEHLLGKGDMLFHPVGLPKPIRVQGAYISDEEVASLVRYLKQQGKPIYEAKAVETTASVEEGIAEDDELFPEAVRLVVSSGEASISKIQRRFRVGYARAARLIDTMEVLGIVGPYEGSKPRKVLITEEDLEDALGNRGLV